MARPAWTAQCTNRKLIGELLPVRRRESHKGDYGRVLLLCGSEGLTGAARLAAKAALRTGSGLVYLGVPEKIYPIIAAGAGSEIVFPLPCDEAGRLCMAALPAITARLPEMDAVLLGPGLGRSEELTRLVQAVLSVCRAPLVLDADGINAAAPHIDVLRGCACPVVLTPHDGEFLRLGGDPRAADRTQEAMRLADRTHAVLLLKGSRTVITDGLNVYVNHTGNPGLAAGRAAATCSPGCSCRFWASISCRWRQLPQPHGCTAPPPILRRRSWGSMAWCRRICCCAFRDFCHKGDICCEKNWRFFSARFPCSCRPARPNVRPSRR